MPPAYAIAFYADMSNIRVPFTHSCASSPISADPRASCLDNTGAEGGNVRTEDRPPRLPLRYSYPDR